MIKFLSIYIMLFVLCVLAEGASMCVYVSDPARLPLWNASISIIGMTIDKQISIKSDKNGVACIDGIPEGLYAVEVSRAGFMNVRYYPIRVAPGRIAKPHFTMPLGEISEGLGARDALLSGTLRVDGIYSPNATICLTLRDSASTPICTKSTDLAEYTISVMPGRYSAEVTTGTKTLSMMLDLSSPGYYINKLTFK